MTAHKFLVMNPSTPGAKWGKIVAIIGSLTSVMCFALLAVPGSPAFISMESWIMLLAWIAIGAAFYFSKCEELNSISHPQMRYLLLGNADMPVLFDTDEHRSSNRKPEAVTELS